MTEKKKVHSEEDLARMAQEIESLVGRWIRRGADSQLILVVLTTQLGAEFLRDGWEEEDALEEALRLTMGLHQILDEVVGGGS